MPWNKPVEKLAATTLSELTKSRLSQAFFARPVLRVAHDLVGKVLVSVANPSGDDARLVTAGRIVEAEAYRGPEDQAAHSRNNRRTSRTEVMFGPPGFAYMFFVYGMHWQFNVVTGSVGEPHAVLVRALEPLLGWQIMASRRGRADSSRGDPPKPALLRELTSGPGKLCQALGLGAQHYGQDLQSDTLFISDGQARRVLRATRVGVDSAGSWALRRWRFLEAENSYVSVQPRSRLRPG